MSQPAYQPSQRVLPWCVRCGHAAPVHSDHKEGERKERRGRGREREKEREKERERESGGDGAGYGREGGREGEREREGDDTYPSSCMPHAFNVLSKVIIALNESIWHTSPLCQPLPLLPLYCMQRCKFAPIHTLHPHNRCPPEGILCLRLRPTVLHAVSPQHTAVGLQSLHLITKFGGESARVTHGVHFPSNPEVL